jgi:hypothetical protein
MLDDLGLLPSKCGITEDFVEDFEGTGHEGGERAEQRQCPGFYQPGRALTAATVKIGRLAEEKRKNVMLMRDAARSECPR